MDDKELYLLCIDLILAIKNNNLNDAKNDLDQLNSIINENTDLSNLLDLTTLINNSNNSTLNYVINNITYYPNLEMLKWQFTIINLIAEYIENHNLEAINDFIDNLTLEDLLVEQLPPLIRLLTIVQNWDTLISLKTLFEDKING